MNAMASAASSVKADARALLSQKRKESALSAGAAIRGKDKVAALKKLRDLQKDNGSISTKNSSSSTANTVAMTTFEVSDKASKTRDVAEARLPPGFYDGEDVVEPANKVMKPAEKFSYPQDQTVSGARTTATAQTVSTTQTSSTSLPQGFFDNPYEDSKARGIDLVKAIQTQEKEATVLLKSFLEEINENNDIQEEVDAREDEVKEQENEAVHMSYVLRYAGLLSKAAQVTEKAPNSTIEVREGEEIAKAFLPVVHEDLINAEGATDDNAVITEAESIEGIMRAKRKEAKRQRKEKETQEYVPLDAADWMARFI